VEMEATGSVIVEGEQFNVNATKVTYAGNKECLVIEGSSYADARVTYQQIPGARQSSAKASKFTYWLGSGVFEGQGFSSGEFWLNGQMRLTRPGR